MLVTGRVHSIGWVGGRAKTLTFHISEKTLLDASGAEIVEGHEEDEEKDVRSALDTILLQGDFVLPSLNPWLTWHLEVIENTHNSNYRVTRVLWCKNERMRTQKNPLGRPLQKSDVVEYFQFAKGFENPRVVMDRLRPLPGAVTAEAIQKFIPADKLSFDPICKQIFELVRVLSQPEPFYALLCFFSNSLIFGLSMEQQLYLLVLLVHRPYIFAFRSALLRALELGEISPFRGQIAELQRFQVTPDYSSFRLDLAEKGEQGAREMLAYRNDETQRPVSTCFHPSLFLLPFETVRALWDFQRDESAYAPWGEQLKRILDTYSEVTGRYVQYLQLGILDGDHMFSGAAPPDEDVLHEAIQLYLHFEQKRFSWGSPVVEMTSYPRYEEYRSKHEEQERGGTQDQVMRRLREETEREQEREKAELAQKRQKRMTDALEDFNPFDPNIVRPLGPGKNGGGGNGAYSVHEEPGFSTRSTAPSTALVTVATVASGDGATEDRQSLLDEMREKIEKRHNRALDFLIANHVLIETTEPATYGLSNASAAFHHRRPRAGRVEAHPKRFLCLYEDHQLDRLFVQTLRRFTKLTDGGGGVHVYRQGWNTPLYPRQLVRWLLVRFKAQIERNHVRLFASSRSWADYMEMHERTVRFESIPHKRIHNDFIEQKTMMLEALAQIDAEQRAALDEQDGGEHVFSKDKKLFTIVFERTHKMSLGDITSKLWELAESLSAREQVLLDQIRFDLHFIGRPAHSRVDGGIGDADDPTDLPVFHRIGSHNVWQDLAALYSDAVEDIQALSLPRASPSPSSLPPWKRSEHMSTLWAEFNNRSLSAAQVREFPSLDLLASSIQEVRRKNRHKIPDRNDPKTKIFCSSRREQTELLKKLELTKYRDYSEHKLYVNDEVMVLETGHYGTIKRTFHVNPDTGVRVDVGKQAVELKLGMYYFVICQCTLTDRCACEADYSSSTHTIVPCRVDLIQRYDGPPVDFVLFYVNEQTTLEEIRTAFGYALEDIQFFWIKRAIASQHDREKQAFTFESVLNRHTKQRFSTIATQMFENTSLVPVAEPTTTEETEEPANSRKRKRSDEDQGLLELEE